MKEISNKTVKKRNRYFFRHTTYQHWYLLSSSVLKGSTASFSSFHNCHMRKSQLVGNQVQKKRIGAVTANRFKRDIARFKMLIIFVGKKSPQKYWHITNPKLQHFFVLMWKMMDIVDSRKCWILVQRRSKCLNSLLESIYF